MAEFDLDKMAHKVAEEALDEFTYKDKTLREWIEIIVAQDLLAIEELEKIKAEINANPQVYSDEYFVSVKFVNKVLDNHISELKGENK